MCIVDNKECRRILYAKLDKFPESDIRNCTWTIFVDIGLRRTRDSLKFKFCWYLVIMNRPHTSHSVLMILHKSRATLHKTKPDNQISVKLQRALT